MTLVKLVSRIKLLEATLHEALPGLRDLAAMESPDLELHARDLDVLARVEALVIRSDGERQTQSSVGELHPSDAGSGKARATSGMAAAPRTYIGSGEDEAPGPKSSAHHMLLDGVSELTWQQRFDAQFRLLGGLSLPPFSDDHWEPPPGFIRQDVIEKAIAHADRTMLNEIHLMLRVLVDREARR